MCSFIYCYFFFLSFSTKLLKTAMMIRTGGGGSSSLCALCLPSPEEGRGFRAQRLGLEYLEHPTHLQPLASTGGEENQNPTLGRTEGREWLDSGPLRQI